MRSGLFLSAILLATAAAIAQQPSAQSSDGTAGTENIGPNHVTVITVPTVSSCPVHMQARQGSSSQMLKADDGTSQPLMTPTLILSPTSDRKIIAATVTAHGHPNVGGTLDLVAHPVDPDHPAKTPEITKTLTIKPTAGEHGSFFAKLQLLGFTNVNFIHLDSVTYDDGSTWKFASGCTVQPDPLLLIAGH